MQGLGGSRHRKYRGILRQELHYDKCLLRGQSDVLLIQEYQLSEKHKQKYGIFLHGQWEMFLSVASALNGIQGGVCIAIKDV